MLFLNASKVGKSGVPDDAAATLPYLSDDVVRDFFTWDEARGFAAKKTDHIGNLLPASPEPGTWVRFSDSGINIVGENHTYVRLVDITAAVGASTFTYEQFATDALPANSEFRTAYLVENGPLLGQFGVDLNGDLTLVGGESLLPKIADTVAELVPYFKGTKPMAELTSAGYLGKPDQRYIKIGWAWAKDLVGHAATAAETALVKAVSTHHDILNPFITKLPIDGYLGDPLVKSVHADKYQPLLELCQAYVPVMIERARNDQELTAQERQELAALPTGTVDQQQEMFGLWRNRYFAKTVAKAAARGVRYAGMGDDHRVWLQKNTQMADYMHVHVVTRMPFKAVIAHTRRLRNS